VAKIIKPEGDGFWITFPGVTFDLNVTIHWHRRFELSIDSRGARRTANSWLAAERLHVVQPAITRQVRQFEEEIGCALFERLKRGVRLTEAGRSILEEARQLLSEYISCPRSRPMSSARPACQPAP